MDLSIETQRLCALSQLKLLDTPPSESFDRITRMATRLFGLPIAAVSLTDRDRQWFKSRVGVDHQELTREKAPCAEVAETAAPAGASRSARGQQVPRQPARAERHPLLCGRRPLVTRDGYGLGAMCVLGTEPRTVTADEMASLADLAAMVMAQIELQHAFGRIETISGLPNRHQWLDDVRDQARDFPGELRSVVILDAVDDVRVREMLRVLGPDAVDDMVRSLATLVQTSLPAHRPLYHVGPMQFAWLIPHRNEAARLRVVAKIEVEVAANLLGHELHSLAKPIVGMAAFRLGATSPEIALRNAHKRRTGRPQQRSLDQRVLGGERPAASPQVPPCWPTCASRCKRTTSSRSCSSPRIDLRSGRCMGAEALLRWRHPELGAISPGGVYPGSPSRPTCSGLSPGTSSTPRSASSPRGGGRVTPSHLSVNVSASNLEEPDFVERILASLAAYRLDTSDLELEVTEGLALRKGTQAGRSLDQVRAAGIRVAVDDFGTGYSSLFLPAGSSRPT